MLATATRQLTDIKADFGRDRQQLETDARSIQEANDKLNIDLGRLQDSYDALQKELKKSNDKYSLFLDAVSRLSNIKTVEDIDNFRTSIFEFDDRTSGSLRSIGIVPRIESSRSFFRSIYSN